MYGYTVIGCFLIEIYASIEPFYFSMIILGSTIRPTTVNKLAVTALQHMLTPSFISVDIFVLFFPYMFDV